MNKKCLFFFLVIVLVNAICNTKLQLHYDEAYYWVYGQNLSLSYYDHPPIIGYFIRLFSILGNSEFAVRATNLFLTTITVITIYKLAQRMFGQKVADIAILLALASPLIEAVFFITTPDTPLLTFWACIFYCFYIWVFENKTQYIYFAGIFAGCALLSKYTAILVFPSLFLFLIFSNKYRSYLLKKELYLSFLLSWMVFLPVIFWNYQHDWISFSFQIHHGMDLQKQLEFASFFDYLGGQVLIAGVFIFLAILFFSIRYFKINIRDDKLAFLLWPFIFVLSFFGFRSFFQHMEANWPAPAYVTAIVLLAYWLNATNNRWVYKASVGFIIIVLVVLKFPFVFIPKALHNKPQIQVVNTFFGTKELLLQARPYIKKEDVVLACDYGTASSAWFYLDLSRAYVLNDFKFSHMYQYWNGNLPSPIKTAIYLCNNEDLLAMDSLRTHFHNVQLLNIAKYDNIVGSRVMYVYKATN